VATYMLMNDIHFSDRPPSSCTDTYLDDLFDICRETTLIAAARGVAGVIWPGDVFHHKTPGRTSHATVRRVIELAGTYPCPVYVVPGNHDMTHDRLDSIDETQPLGVLFASGAVRMLHGWAGPDERLDRDGWTDPIYGVPWLQRFDAETVTAALADYRDNPPEHPHHLVVTHAPLYRPGLELPYEFYPTIDWAAAMGNTGSCHYGHVHEAHGIYTNGGVTFCNPGAISRGSLHEHNLSREVSVAIWDSTTAEFEIVPVPHKPADQVFRLADIAEDKTAQVTLEQFLTSIATTRIEVTSIEAVMAHVRTLDLDEPLQKIIAELLEGVG
jgi:DNA repair exonuclease SbcCD nuclease subunit